MAITQVEYLESTIAEPNAAVEVNNHIVCLNYNLNITRVASPVSIYNMSNGQGLQYPAFVTLTVHPIVHSGEVYYATWPTGGRIYLHKIDSLGNDTQLYYSGSNVGIQNRVLAGVHVQGYNVYNELRHKLSNATVSWFGEVGYPGTDGTNLWLLEGTTLAKKVDPSNGSLIGSKVNIGVNAISTVGIQIGDYIMWPTSAGGPALIGVHATNGTPKAITPTPSGFPYPPNLVATTYKYNPIDGYLYRLKSDTELVILDSVTGRWKIETLSPTRTNRYSLVIGSNGKIYIPSGKPDSWV